MTRARLTLLALILSVAGAAAQDSDPQPVACETAAMRDWLFANLSAAPVLSGAFEGRVEVTAPAIVTNAELTRARIGFSLRRGDETEAPRIAFVGVTINDMRSHDRYGAGIKTHRKDPGITLFLADVTLRPGWPGWVSYDKTNYDGLTLDAAAALYAQAVTISDWNADAAIDSKADVTQLVHVTISGPGHRPLRLWRPGPHYIVHSNISKPGGGALIWLRDCDRAQLRIFASRFNGVPRLSSEHVSCEAGSDPSIAYLSEDPRTTGEMHPVFAACGDVE